MVRMNTGGGGEEWDGDKALVQTKEEKVCLRNALSLEGWSDFLVDPPASSNSDFGLFWLTN